MKTTKSKPQTIGEYIAAAAPEARTKLRQMRVLVRRAAPGAGETLKYGMPAFCYARILVIFGAFKRHIGFYPTAKAMKEFAPQLAKYKGARGSVQFPLDQPLPAALIRGLTAARVRQSIKEDGLWKPGGHGGSKPGKGAGSKSGRKPMKRRSTAARKS
jgi:uncharacterized protein YdhG (YjbR/CyaY superfamily)